MEKRMGMKQRDVLESEQTSGGGKEEEDGNEMTGYVGKGFHRELSSTAISFEPKTYQNHTVDTISTRKHKIQHMDKRIHHIRASM